MPGRFRLGPRRGAALAAGTAGMVVFWLVTMNAGLAWGMVLLAGLAGVALLGTAAAYLEVRRQGRLAEVRNRALAERAQAHQADLRRLRVAAEGERATVSARLEAVARAQRQASAASAWQVAHRSGAGAPQGSSDEEIALLRESELFDPDWYRAQVGMPVADPATHYVDWGAALGIDPHPLFGSARYLERYPEALARWRTPLAHFVAAERDQAVAFAPPTIRYDDGNPDQADLGWEYLVRGLHREADTFVLYRIIGNDLPPRHRAGQGIENLRFVLEHEPDLPGCQKRWVVNRIVDPRIEKQVIALLEEHDRGYLHIPFEPDEYRRVGWRFDGLEPPGLTYRPEFAMLSPGQRQRMMDHVYHFKNLYVMNNNGARNAALREGRTLAKWVLPWDGNCFLTRAAWDELVDAVAARPHLKYFTVPMARVVDNQALLRPDPVVDAGEEPQILFRRDAAEQFDPNARYGRRPKVELFYRLRIPGPWDDWGRVSWDDPPLPPSAEARQVGQASWVARLFSGQVSLETDSNHRHWRRIEAIRECIDSEDQQLAADRYDPAVLFGRDEGMLTRHRARWADGEPGPARVVEQLIQHARLAQRRGRAGGGPQALVDRVTVAVLAGWFTGQERFLSHGADALRAGLFRRFGSMSLGRRGPRFALAEARDLDCLLDAARLLAREGALTSVDAARLRAWCGEYRRWLAGSEPGATARAALDHHGTWYDVQFAALDAYLGDLGSLLVTLRRTHERVGQQLRPEGGHATPDNLLGWVRLAGFAARVGQDLWSFRAPGGPSLAGAVRRLLDRPQPGRDPDRRAVLAQLAAPHLPDLVLADIVDGSRLSPWEVRQVFDPEAAVRPLWVLGSEVDDP